MVRCPTSPAASGIRCRFCSSCSDAFDTSLRTSSMKHESDDSPVSPNAPDARKPVTATPMAIAAGTSTGLKRRKSGVAKARPMTLAVSVTPERMRRSPPTGKTATTASTWDLDGPFSGRKPFRPSGWRSAISAGGEAMEERREGGDERRKG